MAQPFRPRLRSDPPTKEEKIQIGFAKYDEMGSWKLAGETSGINRQRLKRFN